MFGEYAVWAESGGEMRRVCKEAEHVVVLYHDGMRWQLTAVGPLDHVEEALACLAALRPGPPKPAVGSTSIPVSQMVPGVGDKGQRVLRVPMTGSVQQAVQEALAPPAKPAIE